MRYILGVIGFIAIFVILIVLIFSLHSPSGSNTTQTNTPVPKLADLAGGDTVTRFTSDGPIVAEENHRSVRIMIDQHHRSIDVIQGYQGTVLATENFDNNKDAYATFLAALDRAGFTLERKTKLDSEAGLCPTGGRLIFELYNTPNDSSYKPFRRWSTTCSSSQADFGGSVGTVTGLFKAQIPNYNAFISQTNGAAVASF
jgi:hypothetical protein